MPDQRTLHLRSGGTLTVSVVGILNAAPSEREFVFELMALFDAYEQSALSPAPDAEDPPAAEEQP